MLDRRRLRWGDESMQGDGRHHCGKVKKGATDAGEVEVDGLGVFSGELAPIAVL